jgi:dTDP-4-dehydrorhamnose reductase
VKKAYVTGSQGMLGRALIPLFEKEYEVKGTDLPEHDITNADKISDSIASFSPDLVIHLASMTDVDGCQLDPSKAFEVNVTGTRNVAEACRRCDATMVYVSTGMIYNGRKGAPYIEYDHPDPINIYGETKYKGELAIMEILEKYYIFNSCWLFGGGAEDRKFVARIMELSRNEKELRIVDDKFGSPTYTVDLAGAILRVIGSGATDVDFGRYHCVNRGCVNRFELAGEILTIADMNDCRLIPVPSDEFDLPAPRPAMEAMSNYSLDLLGLQPMRDWREALREYITTVLLGT